MHWLGLSFTMSWTTAYFKLCFKSLYKVWVAVLMTFIIFQASWFWRGESYCVLHISFALFSYHNHCWHHLGNQVANLCWGTPSNVSSWAKSAPKVMLSLWDQLLRNFSFRDQNLLVSTDSLSADSQFYSFILVLLIVSCYNSHCTDTRVLSSKFNSYLILPPTI